MSAKRIAVIKLPIQTGQVFVKTRYINPRKKNSSRNGAIIDIKRNAMMKPRMLFPKSGMYDSWAS